MTISDDSTILLMLSGGLDSAYMLYDYLLNSSYRIHAHHVIIKSRREPRWRQEINACNMICKYCLENYRQFDYSYSEFNIDPKFTSYMPYDSDVQAFYGAQIAQNISKGKSKVALAIGWIKDDVTSSDHIHRQVKLKKFESIWTAACLGFSPKILKEPLFPLVDLNKVDIINKVPKPLLRLTWTCRKPKIVSMDKSPYRSQAKKSFVQCGECKSCKELNSARQKIKLRPDVIRFKLVDDDL